MFRFKLRSAEYPKYNWMWSLAFKINNKDNVLNLKIQFDILKKRSEKLSTKAKFKVRTLSLKKIGSVLTLVKSIKQKRLSKKKINFDQKKLMILFS